MISGALKGCCLTFPKIRRNAFSIFFAPRPPKRMAFTSAAMKKKFHPAPRILRSRGEAVERCDQIPVSGVGHDLEVFEFQTKEFRRKRRLLDQNRTDLNGLRHESSREKKLAGCLRAGERSHKEQQQ